MSFGQNSVLVAWQRLATDYSVIACYFKSGNHEETVQWQKEQQKSGFEIDILYADIAQFHDCEKLVSLVMERYGRIDVLVNNAGVTQDSSLKKMSPEQWQSVLNANLTSVFNMTRNTLPAMLEKGYGRIISISSINGRKGQFGQCNYAATKAALFGFTKSLALEIASKGITVNTISPSYIAPHAECHARRSIKYYHFSNTGWALGSPSRCCGSRCLFSFSGIKFYYGI